MDLGCRLEDAHFRAAGPHVATSVVDEALPRLAALCSSADIQDKLIGVTGIEELVRDTGLEDPSRIVRLAANVTRALPCPDYTVMSLAAKVFAKLAALGGLLMITPVDNQLKATIEWLQGERVEIRRFAAVTLLRELAKTVPYLMYEHIPSLLDNMWTALRDAKINIRETAATAMAGCLNIVYQRDGQLKSDWYNMVFEQAQRGFKINTYDSIHGSLLAYKELFLNAGMFMQTRYVEVCDQVLSYKDHRESQVRRAVIELIPTLASYNHIEFVSGYLHKCMVFLLGQLKRDRDRAVSFHAVGHVAVAVGSSMAPYLDAILNSVKEGLLARGRKTAPPEASIFLCIQMLAKSVGQVLTKHMHELLDLMFGFGLSAALCLALHDLASHIPPLLATIQNRLLDTISLILSGQPFRHPGAPALTKSGGSSTVIRDLHVSQMTEGKDPVQVKLALETMGTFDFSGHILSDFVRNCVVAYLEDDSPDIRTAATQTCCKVFARDTVVHQTSQHAIKLVGEVLEKLLTVAIADPDPNIRIETFYALDPKFDRHLAQAENVRSVFLALNDEVYEVREIAIKLIGRLASHNPAYVMPPLRRTLIQLLTELEYSTQTRSRRESAALLGLLIASSLRLTKPYVLPILKVLLPKARDRDPAVSSSIMGALGELARVGGEDVLPRLSEYMTLILQSMGDQASPQKREAALKALGQLASYTGYVIEPYIEHPALLNDLIGILQTDAAQQTRRETIKVIGILGALDPYRHTAAERAANEARLELANASEQTQVEILSSNDDSYYPSVAFRALLGILNDKSLAAHHTAVVEAIMYIFRSLRLKCVIFLPMVMPSYIAAMRSGGPQLVDYYLQNLGQLVTMIKQHARGYLPAILTVIHDYWSSTYEKTHQLQTVIVELIESLAVALEGEFKVYLPTLLPPLLAVFDDPEPTRVSTQLRVLRAFAIFGLNLEEYLHLVVPVIVRAFERTTAPLTVRVAALSTLGALCRKINFADHASRVIHPLTRTLMYPSPVELRLPAMKALCALITQIGSDFAIFVPTINKVLVKQRIQHTQYDSLVEKLLKGEPLPHTAIESGQFVESEEPAADAGVHKLPVNQQNLKVAWEVADRPKAEDWREWMKRLSVQLLKSSPSHSLRACASLAEVYQPLARELFNAAFVSVWGELYDAYQEELVRSIEMALSSPTTPTETIQTLLNLAEFMEHDDKILPIPMRTLGTYAMRCSAFAKALHYKELEALTDLQPEILESLVSINQHLQQHDTAEGVLIYAQKYLNMGFHEEWYEKLEKWDEALEAYSRRYDEDPSNDEVMFGKMTCLHALGEWDDLSQLAEEHWPHSNLEMRRRIAPLAAAAFWGLAKWEQMDDYISVLKHDSAERAWFRAILNIHRGQFPKALSHIVKARDALDNDLTTLAGESYTRAYSLVVRVQMLAELEEIIQYKESYKTGADSYDRRVVIQKTWMTRLRGCQRDVEVWQRILKVRALVMTPRENMEMWIKFANLCRKSGRLGLAEKTVNSLLGEDGAEGGVTDEVPMTGPPHVIYAQLKLKWAYGLKAESLSHLSEFARRLALDLGIDSEAHAHPNALTELELADRVPEFTRLLARCYYKLGEWQVALQDNWGATTTGEVLKHYQLSTRLDPSWHKAWHAWALANSEVIGHYRKDRQQSADEDSPLPAEIVVNHLVPSIISFFRSIALSPSNALQDTLRLLTLWFKHGEREEVSVAMQEGFSSVTIDTWLEVIPQVIARIYARGEHGYVRRLVQQLLADIGRAHPQALVYPLTVASKYDNIPRQEAALAIIHKMKDHSPKLVEHALLVSGELVRVCNLWHEQWHEGLEEASRLFYAENNVNAMLAKLEPLHEMADKGPETLKEMSFIQTYGRDLQDARDSCRRFKLYGDQNDLNQAWDLYYHVFRKIGKTISSVSFIELQYTSPKLLAAKDLELAIPGTYQSGRPIVRIAGFAAQFDVLSSKQHPRKMKITGSDGRDYPFLLKGHEDLRQDERVMQLFGLVNTLLSRDAETFKRHLSIQKYPVIPLATSSGLLGWLPSTDTLHVLIKGYRDSRKILLNIEHRLMLQMAPDYDNMCLMQKIEVFEYAMDNTMGQDLYRILWLKSKNSEAWLDRRTNYTRSLAVMSMVGHILGLGDRHPSNLLLDRHTGTVVHVDFGDCFETAMTRDKFPEQVPFRLTRMLVRAMEISGVEGTFRITCENTMRVLREHQESIIAVLEAFVHDPLINWRLVYQRQVAVTAQGEGARNNPYSRRPRADETNLENAANREEVNEKALQVIERVNQKLTGRDFKPDIELSVEEQVDKLIKQAQSIEAYCTSFIGWCSFW